ncbi:MAG: AIR synthase-related protein, partial [Planctomycetota bacterium]
VPTVDARVAKETFGVLHRAIDAGLVAACHDLSEGGLAAALAEMAFAGGLGVDVAINGKLPAAALLFSESNTRFLCEVADAEAFEQALGSTKATKIGAVNDGGLVRLAYAGKTAIAAETTELKEAWQAPLRW